MDKADGVVIAHMSAAGYRRTPASELPGDGALSPRAGCGRWPCWLGAVGMGCTGPFRTPRPGTQPVRAAPQGSDGGSASSWPMNASRDSISNLALSLLMYIFRVPTFTPNASANSR